MSLMYFVYDTIINKNIAYSCRLLYLHPPMLPVCMQHAVSLHLIYHICKRRTCTVLIKCTAVDDCILLWDRDSHFRTAMQNDLRSWNCWRSLHQQSSSSLNLHARFNQNPPARRRSIGTFVIYMRTGATTLLELFSCTRAEVASFHRLYASLLIPRRNICK
jgi:hypothetical protein